MQQVATLVIFQRQLINLIADEVDEVCMGGVWIGKRFRARPNRLRLPV